MRMRDGNVKFRFAINNSKPDVRAIILFYIVYFLRDFFSAPSGSGEQENLKKRMGHNHLFGNF
jgi:hypothetical protein